MSVSNIPMPFEVAKHLIATEQQQSLIRSPECMDRYNAQKVRFKAAGIDPITKIIVNELFWCPPSTPLTTPSQDLMANHIDYADERPFASTNDIMITDNTFPYYIENSEHLCVWVKFPLPPDPNSEKGDISDEHKKIIEKYIQTTFVDWLGVPRENLTWFKNWAALQSIKSLAHIHVIIKDFDAEKKMKVLNTGGVALKYD